MSDLSQARLTIPEAAFVSGVTVTDINREIDAKVVPSGGRSERTVRGDDLVYLLAIKDVRTRIDRTLRQHMRKAIVEAVRAQSTEAKVHQFVVPIEALWKDLLGPFETLERSKHDHVEIRKEVMGGEPVIRGTRVPVRHIADLLRRGATRAELRDDLELTDEQIEAAVIYDRTTPRRGRPPTRKQRTKHVFVAR